MTLRARMILLHAAVFLSMGAGYQTTNFMVEAPTPQIAQQVGTAAEHYRREKAIQWLGQEMPPWPDKCPLQVKVTFGGAGGATSFAFDRGRVLGQHMTIEGSLDRLLASVLPHEVTHTVFAYYFRCPVPRWADEGGSVLSEDELEKQRHDQLVRNILNTPGRAIPLRRLFALREYPGDVMVLYAEGFSVSQFLVSASDRPTFLRFVAHGMREGWDGAVRSYYRYQNVEDLEQAWLAHLRSTRRQPVLMARNTTGNNPADPTQRVIVRQTAPPSQPLLAQPMPIFRGQSGAESEGDRFEDPSKRVAAGRPGFLPESGAGRPSQPQLLPPRDPWQPAGSAAAAAPPAPAPAPPANGIRLGAPQPLANAGAPAVRPVTPPIGYPH